jgi:hypothetical protein
LNKRKNKQKEKENKTENRKTKKRKKRENEGEIEENAKWARPNTRPGCVVPGRHRPGWCIGRNNPLKN